MAKQIRCTVCEQLAMSIAADVVARPVQTETTLYNDISDLCEGGGKLEDTFGSFLLFEKKWQLTMSRPREYVLLPPEPDASAPEDDAPEEDNKKNVQMAKNGAVVKACNFILDASTRSEMSEWLFLKLSKKAYVPRAEVYTKLCEEWTSSCKKKVAEKKKVEKKRGEEDEDL
ncbi:unnamed protein product [Polarella glacialis]|uniref:Uncharacterized protein n=2 Tax=Polarella glacialis TaxID=89957 RepID=A0A813HID6_POLGL|nr:unnamed protein product [Polarella glacialis]